MRILSFSEKWPKLQLDIPVLQRQLFTTFRGAYYWQQGWPVQVFYKSRSKNREKLGEALIISREVRELDRFIAEIGKNRWPLVTDQEAQDDGFQNLGEMVKWMQKKYGLDWMPVMAKLTLQWTQ